MAIYQGSTLISKLYNGTNISKMYLGDILVSGEGGGVNGYTFAAGRLRENQSVSAALDDTNRFFMDRAEFWSPAYPTNNYRVPLPGYYTTTVPTYNPVTDTNKSERDCPNPYTVDGVYLHAFISGAWVSVLVPSSAVTVQPGVGILLPDCVFPQPVPANTRMMVAISGSVPNGGQRIAGMSVSGATGRLEGSRVGSSSQLSQAAGTAALTGTDGRVGGGIFAPPWIVAKPTSGRDRPTVLIHGDSKAYGKNYFEPYNSLKYLAMGPMSQALDDDVTPGSRRIPYANIAIPSIGIEQRMRGNWSRKLDLIRLVPNRPYDVITTNSYNNGWLQAISGGVYDGDTYREHFTRYYNILKAESQAWGNAPAPIYQERPIPRAGGSVWATTLVGQSPLALTDTLWAGFDADLVSGFLPQLAGKIDVARDYAADTDTNRNRVKVSPKTFTLAADYVSGATSVSLVEQPSVGDNLILNPASAAGGCYVRGVTGTGPYTATIYQGVTVSGLTSGSVVQTSYVHDNIGLHPSNIGGQAMQPVLLEWKAAALAGAPA